MLVIALLIFLVNFRQVFAFVFTYMCFVTYPQSFFVFYNLLPIFFYFSSDDYILQMNPESGSYNENYLDYFQFYGRVCV